MESVNSRTLSVRSVSRVYDESEGIEIVPIAFLVASFGYMLIWTGIGSRVSFYCEIYGPSFFVMLNVVFYISGLPIAVLQKLFDSYFDHKATSRVSILVPALVIDGEDRCNMVIL